MRSLPIWFLTERAQTSPIIPPSGEDPGGILAFSTTEKLTSFLAERKSGEWKINLVSDRGGLIFIIALAHNEGMESISMDPELDGSGGEQITLSDLMSLANSVK